MEKDTPSQDGFQASVWMRNLVLARVLIHRWLPAPLRIRCQCGGMLLLTKRKIIKIKKDIDLIEAKTMNFVSANTNLPVPQIHCAFVRNGMSYIVMERLDGELLGNCWRSMTEPDRLGVVQHMKDLMVELRSISPVEPGKVGNVEYGKLADFRLPMAPCGPFDTVMDFQRHMIWNLRVTGGDPDKETLFQASNEDWPTCFTHADLNGGNVLVKGDKVSGILDWEMAGWYPVYWEYVLASNPSPFVAWRAQAGNILEPLPRARQLEDLRQKVFPNPF